jgi:anti-sigma-K factor RskA
MGLADAADLAELQEMERLYPEVTAARLAIEASLEQHAPRVPLPQPAATRSKVLAALAAEAEAMAASASSAPTKKAPRAAMPPPNLQAAPKPIRWFRTALAASVLLLMGSILLNFYFYSEMVSANKATKALVLQQAALLKKQDTMQASLALLTDPAMRPVALAPVAGGTQPVATVYWNQQSKEVYIQASRLPAPAAGKQYQLWAQVDGKMVDAGLINWNADGLLLRTATVPQAEAFAISLENEGGSPTPTLTAVVAMGKV